jgi:hypothetical protein
VASDSSSPEELQIKGRRSWRSRTNAGSAALVTYLGAVSFHRLSLCKTVAAAARLKMTISD